MSDLRGDTIPRPSAEMRRIMFDTPWDGAYRFNEPLLETLLASPALADGDVILSMLFLSPGRDAGEGGDIAEICAQAMSRAPGLNVVTTRLVGENDAILELLATRLQQALAGGPLLMELPAISTKDD
ncbi:sirohydrochlorin chelatase [Salinicola acroporae]|uniref:sirohydrochlorin chelatase n=1 Tax=Salinicola acroporae TaxID=1541440 RepID=UPI0019826962|nr:hypothetical protein [Salinicola acroporae]